jgi:hypothetical protein
MTEQPPDVQEAAPTCPKCGGAMWDNRASKRNPRAPDFKCRDKSCEGVIWPPRDAAPAGAPAGAAGGAAAGAASAGGEPSRAAPAGTPDDPACPVCGGKMWDDRTSKRNPRAPDFKCRNKPKVVGGPGCEGVIWPPRDGAPRRPAAPARADAAPATRPAARRPRPPRPAPRRRRRTTPRRPATPTIRRGTTTTCRSEPSDARRGRR